MCVCVWGGGGAMKVEGDYIPIAVLFLAHPVFIYRGLMSYTLSDKRLKFLFGLLLFLKFGMHIYIYRCRF